MAKIETKKLGEVLVESGRLMLSDPLFLPEWKTGAPKRIYHYLPTNKTYEYQKDFSHYQDIIEEGKTVNQLISEKILIPIDQHQGEFSEPAMLESMQKTGIWQAFFDNGQAGIAFALAMDDGIYEVMGEWHDSDLKKIWIAF